MCSASRRSPGGGADRPIEPRRAEHIEKTRRNALALYQSHRACIAVRENRFGRALCNRLQLVGSQGERGIPANCLEAPFAFPADAAQRREQSVFMMRALGITRHLRAEHALRRRMIRIAADLYRFAVLDRDAHCAGIGTVMWADGSGELGWSVHGMGPGLPDEKRQMSRFYYGRRGNDRSNHQIMTA